MPAPDLFTNVHKGLRSALFQACVQAGRTADGDDQEPRVRASVARVLHFVAHHGENEDALMLPAIERHLPAIASEMAAAHRDIEAQLAVLHGLAGHAPMDALHLALSGFTARYLEHMLMEEQVVDPAMRGVLDEAELAGFGRDAVARTAPADQRAMLGFMLPAMPPAARAAMLGRLPAALADELRDCAFPTRPERA